MQKISGFICIQESIRSYQTLFGKPIDKICIKNGYENFQTILNNFTPFTLKKDAATAKRNILKHFKKETKKVYLAKIKMEIAETLDEFSLFYKSTSLVAISKGEYRNEIYGPLSANLYTTLFGSPLFANGLKCFEKYREAELVLQEINRQKQQPGTIARLIIKKI